MKKTIILCLFFAFVFSDTTFAESNIPKKQIMEVVNDYSRTIGCLKNLEEKNIINFNEKNKYVVLFSIDPECSGGSAMDHSALAVLIQDYKGRIFIKPSESFPVATNNLPSRIESIYIKENELRYSAKDFNWAIANKDPNIEGDALCCPSLNVEGRLSFKNGKWEAESISIYNVEKTK